MNKLHPAQFQVLQLPEEQRGKEPNGKMACMPSLPGSFFENARLVSRKHRGDSLFLTLGRSIENGMAAAQLRNEIC
jgi:hypothetical protein